MTTTSVSSTTDTTTPIVVLDACVMISNVLRYLCLGLARAQLFKEGLRYSDPKDWHVIAAARAAQENFSGRTVGVLTKNLKDFNKSELRRMGLVLWAPDQFLEGLWAEHARLLLSLLEAMPDA